MKAIVICIDALDYDTVVKFNLKHLKQKEFGKTVVPITLQGYALSPHVWSSFLCGKDTKLSTFKKYDNFILQSIMNRFHPNVGIGKILSFFGIKQRHYKPSDLDGSILSSSIKSYHINMPFYTSILEIDSILMEDYFKKKITPDEMKEKLIKRYISLKRKTFNILSKKKNWQLFMIYFHFLDIIQHLFYKDKQYIKMIYHSLDDFIFNVSKLIGKDFLLIVSDHGAINGDHSKYGFYSSNKILGLKTPKIIEFKGIIKKMIEKQK